MARQLVIGEKPLVWVGSCKRDFLEFPEPVKGEMGNALGVAQFGGKHSSAKPWKGEGPGVFEIVEDFDGDAYRAIYTVQFGEVIYVLHAFQKKSRRGVQTTRGDVELVRQRLRAARQDYETLYDKGT
ncbi:MAG: type II toxin-antitoxin system RelE/ParE family toxin [Proteobacteria bacterium]|nr:type II toxin-antitoxin system RelE/ParE family toxin [Pseudomonadota bacterium]